MNLEPVTRTFKHEGRDFIVKIRRHPDQHNSLIVEVERRHKAEKEPDSLHTRTYDFGHIRHPFVPNEQDGLTSALHRFAKVTLQKQELLPNELPKDWEEQSE